MKTFIDEVVDRLYSEYKDDISDVKIILPSSRARLFFNSSLTRVIEGRPIWQPEFYSVDSLTEKITKISHSESFRLLVELYMVYGRYHKEPFDKFYTWGEMLLRDFEAIDNYMVDAKRLFINLNDLKTIDNAFDYLTEEQAALVSSFWSVFSLNDSRSKHQESFLTIWNTLFNIYADFKDVLRKKGFGYKGMIYRDAAEKLESGAGYDDLSKESVFAVIGFNALSKSEKKIFRHLKDNFTVRFFWDYDNYYYKNRNQEAGLFVRENIELLGDECSDIDRNNFVKPKEITIVNAPTISVECKYAWNFLEQITAEYAARGEKPGRETAIVLTDEAMLMPVIYSIPPSIDYFNITSGYDVSQTAAYSLIEYLISLQINGRVNLINGKYEFYYKDVLGVFSHPYFCSMLTFDEQTMITGFEQEIKSYSHIYIEAEKLAEMFYTNALVFRNVENSRQISDYLSEIIVNVTKNIKLDDYSREKREYLTKVLNSITVTYASIANCGIEVSRSVFLSLLRKHISSSKISFMGEPLLGVQVMGILETRSLDFENVLILSVNEDKFPGSNVGKSFIPYSLRRGYDMPTPYHTEAMYSYYFYRLLQRAKKIHITYCSKSEGVTSGEASRYIHQLRLESPFRNSIYEKSLSLSLNISKHEDIAKNKDERVMKELAKFLDGKRTLSASALHKYIECPYSFYLRYIEGIIEPKEVEEEIENKVFGTVVHKIIEKLYSDINGVKSPEPLLRLMLEKVKSCASEILSEEIKIPQSEFSAKIKSNLAFIVKYVTNVINHDIRNSGFTLTGHEIELNESIKTEIDGQMTDVRFFGYIDREDSLLNGVTRIIDYKTGKEELSSATISELFDSEKKQKLGIFQSLLYCRLLSEKINPELLKPTLYFTRKMESADYNGTIKIDKTPVERFSQVIEEFDIHLKQLLKDIFDKDKPFVKSPTHTPCKYCPYVSICDISV